MIQIKNLKKLYGERTVLDIPMLEIEKGECVVLLHSIRDSRNSSDVMSARSQGRMTGRHS